MSDPRSSSDWPRVKEILDGALEREGTAREAYLEAACGNDAELRREVESLMEAAGWEWSLVDDPGRSRFSFEAERPERSRIGDRIGPYEIVSELGRGGMGQVFLARRADDEFQKKVAIKLVPPGPARELALSRFRSERQISATLEHPHIARLLDGGTTAAGEPYIVMEYVEGKPLVEFAEEHRLSTEERLRLFREVCEAVQYAHRNLVVHRDIKPSNILVTAEGVPKLLDFGIAKLLDPAEAASGGQTGTLVRIMTPDYASPEQVRGGRVSTSSDVYSLGVVLYELLSGRKPYRIGTGDPAELVRLVCEEDPERPSQHAPKLSGDLDAIVLKAMRKEPEHRYPSVDALSQDAGRYLEGRPIGARRGSAAYRLRKFMSRNRVAVAAAALLLVAIAGGIWMTLVEARRARAAEARAERRFNDVRKLANSFLIEFHDAIQNLPGSTPARMLVVRRGIEYLDSLSVEAGDSPDLLRELARGYERLGDIQGNSGRGSATLGDMIGARKSLEKALALRERLVASGRATLRDRIALAETYDSLSGTYTFHGETQRGIDFARRAVAAAEAIHSSDPDARYQLANSNMHLGDALRYGGRGEEALGAFVAARRVYEPLRSEIRAANWSRAMFAVDYKIAAAENQLGKYPEAAAAARRAVEAAESLLRADPGNGQAQRDLSMARGALGEILMSLGDASGAEENFRRKIEMMTKLADADPQNANPRIYQAEAYDGLSRALLAQRRVVEARQVSLESVRILEKLLSGRSDDVFARSELGACYLGLARTFGAGEGADPPELRKWLLKSRQTYRALQAEGKLSPIWGSDLTEIDETLARLDGKRADTSRH